MTFLAQYSQLMYLKMEQTELQFRRDMIQRMENQRSREMSEIESNYKEMQSSGQEVDCEDDPYYRYLERQSTLTVNEIDSIDAQLEVINGWVSAAGKTVENGIKSSCSTTINSSS